MIAGKLKDGFSLHECNEQEKSLVRKLKLIRRDIHIMLASVGCDIADIDN
ncbi:hypothetical protein ECMP0210175_0741 [Escherichia coli MP021017.5]|nr:hypothetical protein ECMP0210179_2715 [Escherichia coli MP021017.9]EMU80265.1 hypothetical protein ECMP0210176_2800 [Escherichia coli MP021017.6]EMU87698.1 hypothetical protein ECMP0210175_0741 [Escherichia coli MP021017.5]EMU92597.1 hypothetical protein ECMP0210174_2687 [Escherichia coli MP021017.4]EMU97519.1 hypothetical protein ECMP0210172_2742 [Escherichia coli MP021017.2]EMV05803.1 hypothetical protein ECMP02101710_2787 [Escherichia coli MP021017.10]EMV10620.1 hypothetical protein ECM